MPPEVGVLIGEILASVGLSYENAWVREPLCPSTVAMMSSPEPEPWLTLQIRDDSDRHEVERHLKSPVRTAGQKLLTPMSFPRRETITPPLVGPFAGNMDNPGLS